MRYAIVDTVTGLVEQVGDYSPDYQPPEGFAIVPSDTADVGWQLVEGNLIPPTAIVTGDQVNAERDRRVAAGFAFGGHLIHSDDSSKIKISGAVQLATLAILAGAQPGNLRWHGGDADFGWGTMDGALLPLDAQSMVNLGKAAAAWEQAHYTAARAIKGLSPIPADFAAASRWPVQ